MVALIKGLTLVRTHGTGRPPSVARPSRASRDPPRAPEDPPSGPRLTLVKRKALPPLERSADGPVAHWRPQEMAAEPWNAAINSYG